VVECCGYNKVWLSITGHPASRNIILL